METVLARLAPGAVAMEPLKLRAQKGTDPIKEQYDSLCYEIGHYKDEVDEAQHKADAWREKASGADTLARKTSWNAAAEHWQHSANMLASTLADLEAEKRYMEGHDE